MMPFPVRLFVTVIAVIGVSLWGAYLLGGDVTWLPIGISIASLAVALLGSFRNELFGFSPVVLGGDVVLAPTNPPSKSFSCVVPLQFINRGYGEGIVEWVAVRLTAPGLLEPAVLGPIAEIDLRKFLQERRHLHAENTLGAWAPFRLEDKASTIKAILFTREEQPGTNPASIDAGEWKFEIFLKSSDNKKAKPILDFSHTFPQEVLDQFVSGHGVYMMNRKIELP